MPPLPGSKLFLSYCIGYLCINLSPFLSTEKQEKEIDIYANLSDEKAFVFSVALAEINRKIINQRLILWYLPSKSVATFLRITSVNSQTVVDSQSTQTVWMRAIDCFFCFLVCGHTLGAKLWVRLCWDFLVYQGLLPVFCVGILLNVFTKTNKTTKKALEPGWVFTDWRGRSAGGNTGAGAADGLGSFQVRTRDAVS